MLKTLLISAVCIFILPAITLAVLLRFHLVKDESKKLDLLQKWGGDDF